MTLRARSCAAALVTVGIALYTESAHADAAAGARAAPTCSVALAAFPAAGVTLPANAPALLVVDRSEGNSPSLQASLVQGAMRTQLAATTDAHGLWTLPIAGASAGAYSVEIATSCETLSDEQSSVTQLTLTDPVAFPTSVGTLALVPRTPPTGVDTVRLQPTDSMRAFMPATQLEVVVAGATTAKSTFVNATAPIELAVHTGEACVENGALHREKRTVKVSVAAAIAGLAESPAPASLDVEIDCGAIEWTSGLDLDGDAKTPGRATETTTSSSSASSNDAGGCSASPVGTRGSGLGLGALLGVGLGLVALRRRR